MSIEKTIAPSLASIAANGRPTVSDLEITWSVSDMFERAQ
jgi:hypothetical protein